MRVLSEESHVVNEKRSCLLPSYVNMMVFLAENLKGKSRVFLGYFFIDSK